MDCGGPLFHCSAGRRCAGPQETAARGLQEALEVAASRAVEFLGQVDGFLENADVRIAPPAKMEGVAKTLRRIGLDRMVDDFEPGMNRAAEAAAPLAMDVFRAVVRDITFKDALPIVSRQLEEVDPPRLEPPPWCR